MVLGQCGIARQRQGQFESVVAADAGGDAKLLQQALAQAQANTLARVGDGDRCRLKVGAVDVREGHAGQQRQARGVFGEAQIHAGRLQHGRVVDRLDRHNESAGQAVELGVFGVDHRIADLDRLGAVECGAQLQDQLVALKGNQGAAGAQSDRVARFIKDRSARDRQDTHLGGHTVAIGQQCGDGQHEQARRVLHNLNRARGREVLVTAGIGGIAQAHIDFDDHAARCRVFVFVLCFDINGGQTDGRSSELQELEGCIDIGHTAADPQAFVDAAHFHLGTLGRHQCEQSRAGGERHFDQRAVGVADHNAADQLFFAQCGGQCGWCLKLCGRSRGAAQRQAGVHSAGEHIAVGDTDVQANFTGLGLEAQRRQCGVHIV